MSLCFQKRKTEARKTFPRPRPRKVVVLKFTSSWPDPLQLWASPKGNGRENVAEWQGVGRVETREMKERETMKG